MMRQKGNLEDFNRRTLGGLVLVPWVEADHFVMSSVWSQFLGKAVYLMLSSSSGSS